MRIPVSAVLFVKLDITNWKALTVDPGQYDLRLTTDPSFDLFFNAAPKTAGDEKGGWTRRVEIEAFGGPSPVPGRSLTFRYMGPGSARKNYDFPLQRYNLPEAYPLWRADRVASPATPFTDIDGAVALVIRDVDGHFHARWIPADDVVALPKLLQGAITSQKKGVLEVQPAGNAPSAQAREVLDALVAHHNVLLYGPPGTGKTHLVQEAMRAFGTMNVDTTSETTPLTDGESTRTVWSTFHQSYSYEDFVVGLRPRPRDGGGFTLEPVAGTLLEASEWARRPGHRSLLIIDEINRGNVSRIFGELVTLLEVDKRLGADGAATPTTVEARLPYVSRADALTVAFEGQDTSDPVPFPFTLPRDVYVLATMNSVDSSVAPLDAALRRRFTMLPLEPDFTALRDTLGLSPQPGAWAMPPATRDDVCELAIAVVTRLNAGIARYLGQDFCLGPWYLRDLAGTSTRDDATRALAAVWTSALLPQLLEYFVGRPEQLLEVLGNPTTGGALRVEKPTPAQESLGASPYVAGVRTASSDNVCSLLVDLAGGPTLPLTTTSPES